jgi:hypothetical protein
MRAFDGNGNVKLTKLQLGTGLALQDPVLVSQGGTGLISCAQGDLLYGSDPTVKTYPTPLVGTPAGMVLLSNEAANLNLTGQYSNGTYGSSVRGWLGYNGVTQLTESDVVYHASLYPSGGNIAYFATSDVATALEALVVGIPIVTKLPKDASGVKVLMNTGTSRRPAWADPKTSALLIPEPVTRKFALTQWMVTSTGTFSNIWSISQDGTISNIAEPVGIWLRATTAAVAASNGGHRPAQNWCWLDHNPTLRCILRTGPTLTNSRIWVVLANTTAAIGNSDDQHTLKGVGVRYSVGAPDPGWVTWKSDGTTQTVGGAAITAIAANTAYPISIEVTGGGANFTVTVGDSSSTVAVPAGALGTLMRFNIQVTTTAAEAKYLDFLSGIYGEWD